jgi:L-threonylcarbamoyladenylate synthase
VMSFHSRPTGDTSAAWIQAPADPDHYGHDLYANLRALDISGCDQILVEEPPASPEWTAIRDRLSRACSR